MADDVYSPIPGRAIKEFLSVGKNPSYLLEIIFAVSCKFLALL